MLLSINNPLLHSNVADFADKLPSSVVKKGGAFIVSRAREINDTPKFPLPQSMYQREAMWMSFRQNTGNYAVRISVGGVNALTGLSRYERAPEGVQDYLAINRTSGQP